MEVRRNGMVVPLKYLEEKEFCKASEKRKIHNKGDETDFTDKISALLSKVF